MKKINLTRHEMPGYASLTKEQSSFILEIRENIEFNYILSNKAFISKKFKLDMHDAALHTTKHLISLGAKEVVIGVKGLVYTTLLADKLYKNHILPVFLPKFTDYVIKKG